MTAPDKPETAPADAGGEVVRVEHAFGPVWTERLSLSLIKNISQMSDYSLYRVEKILRAGQPVYTSFLKYELT